MGIFNKMFGSSDASETPEPSKLQWTPLTNVDQLDTIVEESKTQPVAIFKHSTRCGISRMVIKQFESSYDLEENQMKVYYLDLLNYRPISEEIAAKFQVWHESPQLVVLKNGVTVAHASHSQINALSLEQYI
ncbi:bacillithiol system redox-active protein YtxJ [Kordia sp. YSTF-M3]|uniref:Bacillithiol system redox-active protein YtxJ n=1 Tax=Kordia aestuariivivens TaxID=2759037 RepID=A0ABR7QD01_9FLAO|nr:bacillithiol system redox-active protein YtxJ [Kordia aestuariivivens]MBC8756214.1 bacillithiol system redox-active protein YtxJ [Kordia aestuariivivens]